MNREDEERDYLVGTQLPHDPDSFVQVVKEAFQLEHGVTENQDIASILGVSKGRVSQIFKNPARLKGETVRMILNCLNRPLHRKRILRAWNRATFGELVAVAEKARGSAGEVSALTLRRVDRMIRESRWTSAAALAEEVAQSTRDTVLREMALDRISFSLQRLDEPGRAMDAVLQIVGGAIQRSERLREAAGHLYRFRILLGLADTKPTEVDPILDRAEMLTRSVPPPPEPPPYLLGSPATIGMYRLNSRLLFMERGVLGIDETLLDEVYAASHRIVKGRDPLLKKFHAWQTLARVHLLRGESFQASEAIDKAFESGGLRNLQTYEMSGLLMARVRRLTEGPGEAAQYMKAVAENCREKQDRYHLRLVEWERARHLSGMLDAP
jgi:transcriptional regulator with XRE-family HTH domain